MLRDKSKKVESRDKGVFFSPGRFSGSAHGGFGLGTKYDSLGIAMRDDLQWLEGYLHDAAKNVTDPALLIASGVSDEWKHLAVIESEFGKSVVHLYPAYEAGFARQFKGR